MSDENGTISNATFTRCQHCGEWTNYAGDEHYKFRQQECEQLRARNEELERQLAEAKADGIAYGIKRLEESMPPSAAPWDCCDKLREVEAELRKREA